MYRPQDDAYDRHGDFPREQFNQRRFPGPPDRQGPPHASDRGPPSERGPDRGTSHATDQGQPHGPVHVLPREPEHGSSHGQERVPVHGLDRRPPTGPDCGPRPDQEKDRVPPNSSQRPERLDNWPHMDRPQQQPFRTRSPAVQDPRAQIHSQEALPSQRGPPIHQSGGPPLAQQVQRRPMGGPPHPPQQNQRGPIPDLQRRDPFPQQQQQQQHRGPNIPPQSDAPRGPPRYNEPFDRPPSNQPPSEQFFHDRPTPLPMQQQQPPPQFHGPQDFNPEMRMRAPSPNQPSRFPLPDRQRPQSPGQFQGGPPRQPQFQSHDAHYQGNQQFGSGGPNQQQHPSQRGHFQPPNDQGGRQHQLPPSGDPRMQRPPPGPQSQLEQQQQQRGSFNQLPNESFQHSQRDFPPHGEHFDNRGPLPHHIQPQQGSDGNWSPSPHTGIPPGQFRDERLRSGGDADRYEQQSHDPRDRGRRDVRDPNRDRDRDRGDRRERSPPRRRMSNERDVPLAKRSRNEKREKEERVGRDRPRSKRD